MVRKEEFHVFRATLVDVSVDGEGNLVLFLERRRNEDAEKLAKILKQCVGTRFLVTLRGWRTINHGAQSNRRERSVSRPR